MEPNKDKQQAKTLSQKKSQSSATLSSSQQQILPDISQGKMQMNSQICVSDLETYNKQFFTRRPCLQLHIYIWNCGIKQFKPLETKFPNLKTLSLDNNQIVTLEPLPTLYMPNLLKLLLFNNKITSIRPLAKMHSGSLSELSLSMNPIHQAEFTLHLCNIQRLKELRLYNTGDRKGSLCSCAKLNCYFVKELGFEGHLDHEKILKNKLIPHLYRHCK